MAKLNDNPLACGLLGFILGAGGILGGQALVTDTKADSFFNTNSQKKETNFDKIPYDPDGDIVITPSGDKYHYEWCYTLNKAKKIRRANRHDAEAAGLEPCSRCQQ